MGRVIHTDTAGKDRTRLLRSAVLALRELMQQNEADDHTRDLSAYLALVLDEVSATVEATVIPWEKRDYWVKADRFRMEWDWTRRLASKMKQAVLSDDWAEIAQTSAQVAMRLNNVKVPQRHQLGEPWIGAMKQLRSTQQAGS